MEEDIKKILMACVDHGYSISLAGMGMDSDYTKIYVTNKKNEILKIIEENKE